MILQSRKTLEGSSRSPHRAMYKAMGLNDEDLGKHSAVQKGSDVRFEAERAQKNQTAR